MSKLETKTSNVLNHLKTKKSITSWEAIKLYRATRLSSIIYNLRHRGYNIQSIKEYNADSNTPYARYVLLRSKNER